MRPIEQITEEITELTDRRAKRWHGHASGEAGLETVADLTARIDALWDELRTTRVVTVHGSPDLIRRRADRERRMEIELARLDGARALAGVAA